MVKKLTIRRKAHTRKSYVKDVIPGPGIRKKRIKGTRVKASTYKAQDRGKPGRTPKKERWFQEAIMKKPPYKLGWKKDEPQVIRLRKSIASRPKSWSSERKNLSAFRALTALANVTTDKRTEELARKDAVVLRRRI